MADMLATGQGMCGAPGSIFPTLCQVSPSCLEGTGFWAQPHRVYRDGLGTHCYLMRDVKPAGPYSVVQTCFPVSAAHPWHLLSVPVSSSP